MSEAEDIVGKLTKAQQALVLASEPGAWGREDDGLGVEISGSKCRVARKLETMGLGTYSDGSPYGDLYFNNALGLEVRRLLQEQANGR